MDQFGPDLLRFLEIVWINIVLSGDNAMVIAMACRGLPPDRRRLGTVLGAGAAVALRIVFTLVLAAILAAPFLTIAGGLLLLWVALKLLGESERKPEAVGAPTTLSDAVRTVAVADAVMSLDNVLAIEAVARGSVALLIAGLLVSVPLIVAGASIIMKVLDRLPILVWAGAGLLGWLAGGMAATDPAVTSRFGVEAAARAEFPASVGCAILVLAVGFVFSRRRPSGRQEAAVP